MVGRTTKIRVDSGSEIERAVDDGKDGLRRVDGTDAVSVCVEKMNHGAVFVANPVPTPNEGQSRNLRLLLNIRTIHPRSR